MSILKTYNNICRYDIHKPIQPLDCEINVDAIKQEALHIIKDGSYGFTSIILTLPPGRSDWSQKYEDVEFGGINACGEDYSKIKWVDQSQPKFSDGTDYTEWHPLCKHIRDLKTQLEEHSGLQIIKARLIWMMPDYAYPMHCDYEPMRFHVPLLTNSYSYFIHSEKLCTMPYGSVYHLITDDVHTAMNYGLYPRLHLVYSTYADDSINQQLQDQVQAKIKNLDTVYTNQQDLNSIIQLARDQGRTDLAEIYESHKKINTSDEKDGH